MVLDAVIDIPFTRKALLAIALMLAIVIIAAAEILSIAISASFGALGMAMLRTGAADYVAMCFVGLHGQAHPRIALGGLMLLLIGSDQCRFQRCGCGYRGPIGISIAEQLGMNPEPFVLAVLFGVNMSFITPMAYKTNSVGHECRRLRFH